MKKLLLLMICFAAFACSKDNLSGDTPWATDSASDLVVSNLQIWESITGTFYENEPVPANAQIHINVSNAFGRTVTLSSDVVEGIYVPQTELTLNEGKWSSAINVPVEGSVGSNAGDHLLHVTISYDPDKKLAVDIPFTIIKRAPLEFSFTPGWNFTDAVLVAGSPVAANATLNLAVVGSEGRKVTISSPQTFLYVPETVIQLPSNNDRYEFSVPLAGTCPASSGSYFLNLSMSYGGGTVTFQIPYQVASKPDIKLTNDPLFTGYKFINTSAWFRDEYQYNVLGTPTDFAASTATLQIPYTYGGGRTIAITSYDIVDPAGNSLKPGWSLQLVNTGLEDNLGEIANLGIKLVGTPDRHVTFSIKNLVMTVTDPADASYNYLLDAAILNFPPQKMKFRVFDIIWTHRMGGVGGLQTLKIGYDTVRVSAFPGSGGPVRALFQQALGAIDNPSVYTRPFFYQWGRKEDGHQVCYNDNFISGLTTVQSDNPATSDFITTTATGASWQPNPLATDKLWDGTDNTTGGSNNPCPTGYRIMSTQEGNLRTNANSGVPALAAGFFCYNGGWVAGVSGTRSNTGAFNNLNFNLWSSTAPTTAFQGNVIRNDINTADGSAAYTFSYQAGVGRVAGMPVRCISYQSY